MQRQRTGYTVDTGRFRSSWHGLAGVGKRCLWVPEALLRQACHLLSVAPVLTTRALTPERKRARCSIWFSQRRQSPRLQSDDPGDTRCPACS